MNNFISQQDRSLTSVAAFGFISRLLRLETLFYLAWLLVFSVEARGATVYTYVEPIPVYRVNIGNYVGIREGEAAILDGWSSWITYNRPFISTAFTSLSNPFPGIYYNNDYPTIAYVTGSYTYHLSNGTSTTYDCMKVGGGCGNATLWLLCPYTNPASVLVSAGRPNPDGKHLNYACRLPATTPIPPQDPPGPQQCPNLQGNPIDLTTGIKIQPETDYAGPDGLEFKRTYRSSTGQFSSILTSNWLAANTADNRPGNTGAFYNGTATSYACGPTPCSYPQRFPIITLASNELFHYLYTPDGKRLQFTEDGNGLPIAKADTNVGVIKNPDPATQSIWLWEVTREDDSHEQYDNQGRLTAKWSRNGLKTTYRYSDTNTASNIAPRPGLMIQITSAYGRSLNFTYNAKGQLVTMTDPEGGVYSYAYNDAAAPDNLTSVTYPDGKTKTYVYNESAYLPAVSANPLYPYALTGIIDENGNRYATFTYDTNGRAISSKHYGTVNNVADQEVDQYSFDYTDANNTAVTNPLGTVFRYAFSTIQKNPRITDTSQPGGSGCNAADNAVTYDANGNIASRTDFNGSKTTYTYDLTRNLETSRTEGLTSTGASTAETRTITTAWHPTFRLPVQITNANLEITYTYNSQGDITQKTLKDIAANTTQSWNTRYTYDASGVLLQKVEDGPRTDVADLTTYDYYPADAACAGGHLGCRGQLMQVTSALGHLSRMTRYSAHGQPEELIDPNGLVTILIYDVRQRLISVDAGGEITRYAYDPAGQLTRITRPDGSYLAYRYDTAHRLITIQDPLGNTLNYTLDAMGNRLKEDLLDPGGQLARSQSRVYDALSRLQSLVLPQ